MKLFRLLALRALAARPLRALLSMFGIVLGVAAILAIGITNQTALAAVVQLFEDTSGKADLVVTSRSAEATGFSENLQARVEKTPGVAAAVPSLQEFTVLAGEAAAGGELDLSFFGAEVGGLLLYGVDPQRDREARPYTLAAGRFLDLDPDAAELLLVADYAADNDLELGEEVAFVAGEQIAELRLVGLIEREGPGQLNNGAFGVLPLGTAQDLFNRAGQIDQLDLLAAPEQADSEALEALRLRLQDELGPDFSVVYPASQGRRMTQMLGNYQIGLNFLSAMALFVGAFLIYNAFSMTVVERTREFGMLRTLGMARGQVVALVMVEALLMGVLGAALGVGLGYWMANGLSQLMGVMIGQAVPRLQAPQGLVVTGVGVGLLVAVFAAALPAFQAGRVSPLEALRIRSQARAGWLLRNGWLPGAGLLLAAGFGLVWNPFPDDPQFRFGSLMVFALFMGGALVIPATVGVWERLARPLMAVLFGRVGQLGSRNIQRSPLRTTLTVAALMIGIAMIVIVWVMTDSFKGDLDEWLEGYMGGDLYVTSPLPIRANVINRLKALEGVAGVAPVRYFEAEWRPPGGDWEPLQFMALDPASYGQVTSFVYADAPPDALQQLAAGGRVFISSVLAEKYGLQPGGSVELKTRAGARPFEIAAVVVDYYNQGLVVSGAWSDMERFFRLRDANALLVKTGPGYAPDAVGDLIEARLGERENLVVLSNQALLGRITTLMRQAFSMFDVLALIAMLVGFMGITNTLSMNVLERTQEIGMLRGVGMTRGQVMRMVLAEAALMGLIGGLVGLLFGAVLARLFMLAMTAMSGYRLEYVLPAGRLVAAVLVAFFTSQLAALLPTLRAARTRILDAIQYE